MLDGPDLSRALKCDSCFAWGVRVWVQDLTKEQDGLVVNGRGNSWPSRLSSRVVEGFKKRRE